MSVRLMFAAAVLAGLLGVAVFTVPLKRRMAFWFGAKIGMLCGSRSRHPATAWRSCAVPFGPPLSKMFSPFASRIEKCVCSPEPE